MRGGNSFADVFSESHNIRYSAKQLEYLEKRTAIFLLHIFTVFTEISTDRNLMYIQNPRLAVEVDNSNLAMKTFH